MGIFSNNLYTACGINFKAPKYTLLSDRNFLEDMSPWSFKIFLTCSAASVLSRFRVPKLPLVRVPFRVQVLPFPRCIHENARNMRSVLTKIDDDVDHSLDDKNTTMFFTKTKV